MNRSFKFVTPAVVAALSFAIAVPAASAAPDPAVATGFEQPFLGTPRYANVSASFSVKPADLNVALGKKATARIAARIGLDKEDAFTPEQFKKFVAGKGVGGDKASAKLVDQSVRILTNTVGRPLVSTINGKKVKTVLASYGLIVNKNGLLESPANSSAPTRQVNVVIEPGGYLSQWCKANGASKSYKALYESAFTREAVYGNKAQQQTDPAELVPNTLNGKSYTVGMSMAPSIWIVNFALIYMLNPKLAAKMPAYWTPIPTEVAAAIAASPTGQVQWTEYEQYFPAATKG